MWGLYNAAYYLSARSLVAFRCGDKESVERSRLEADFWPCFVLLYILLILALLIGLQNLPEGFNAYRELVSRKENSPKKTLFSMATLVVIGPIAGLSGFYFLSDHQAILGAIMLFASGGVLYLIFQDIAPQSRLDKRWEPPLGAVLGFCVALFSEMLVTNV